MGELDLDLDRLTELGLYDRASPNAEVRLALLRYLTAEGATVEDMVEANQRGRLAGLIGDRLLRFGRRMSIAEVESLGSVPPGMTLRLWRAMGFPDPGPDDVVITDQEASLLSLFRIGSEIFGEDVTVQLVRIISSSMARIAEAELSLTFAAVPYTWGAGDEHELDAAQAYSSLVSLLPQMAPLFDVMHRIQIQAAIQRAQLLFPEGAEPTDAVPMTVGFVDVVGSTPLAQQLTARELAATMAEFERAAADSVGGSGGRLVKTIGDEVMFVMPTPAAGCDVSLSLIEEFADHAVIPGLRGGVASGPVLPSEGDYFGPTVNLAARLVKMTEPDSVLVGAAVAAACAGDEHFVFTPAGAQAVKGFDDAVEVFRVTRAGFSD